MNRAVSLFMALALCLLACQNATETNNVALEQLVIADQADRTVDSDEPTAPKDELRRLRLFELLAQGKVVTPKDKYNAALILQHTGMIFSENKLKSQSVENHYFAFQLAKAAFEEGCKEAQYFIAVTYDRYSWMAFGYQKYGTQSTFSDEKEVWVTIDSTTTDEERAQYRVPPLETLLKQKPML